MAGFEEVSDIDEQEVNSLKTLFKSGESVTSGPTSPPITIADHKAAGIVAKNVSIVSLVKEQKSCVQSLTTNEGGGDVEQPASYLRLDAGFTGKPKATAKKGAKKKANAKVKSASASSSSSTAKATGVPAEGTVSTALSAVDASKRSTRPRAAKDQKKVIDVSDGDGTGSESSSNRPAKKRKVLRVIVSGCVCALW